MAKTPENDGAKCGRGRGRAKTLTSLGRGGGDTTREDSRPHLPSEPPLHSQVITRRKRSSCYIDTWTQMLTAAVPATAQSRQQKKAEQTVLLPGSTPRQSRARTDHTANLRRLTGAMLWGRGFWEHVLSLFFGHPKSHKLHRRGPRSEQWLPRWGG